MRASIQSGNVISLTQNRNYITEADAETVRRWVQSREHRHVTVICTPEIAQTLLEYNHHNRTLRSNSVAALARTMREGNWVNTGQPVIVSDERWLNNGQHFLAAVIESGVACEVDVRFGIERRAFAATDSGYMRTGGDALENLGVPNAKASASVARLTLCYWGGLPAATKVRVSTDMIVRAIEVWPGIPHTVATGYVLALGKGLLRTPVRTLSFFISEVANEATRAAFFTELGIEQSRRHVLSQLYDALVPEPGTVQGRDMQVRQLAMCILAWTAWSEGDIFRRIAWAPGMPFPKMPKLQL